jgi:glutamyl-tRNA synthetase
VIEHWNNENIKAAIEGTAEKFEMKMGKIGQPLRVAVSGTGVSPNIDDTLRLIGKEKTLARLGKAISFIKVRASM